MPITSCGRPSTPTVCPRWVPPPRRPSATTRARESRAAVRRDRDATPSHPFLPARRNVLGPAALRGPEAGDGQWRRIYAQWPIVRGDVHFTGPRARPATGGALAGGERADVGEGAIHLPEFFVLQMRKADTRRPRRRKLRRQSHQLPGPGIDERPKQHAVDDREDGGVGADSEGARRYQRDHGESRGFAARSRNTRAGRRASRSSNHGRPR